MRRTRPLKAKASVENIKKNLEVAEKRKKELQKYLQDLRYHYKEKNISYAKYIEILHKTTDGRNIHQLIEHYEDIIKKYKKEIKKQKINSYANKTLTIISVFFIISLLIFVVYKYPQMTGRIVEDLSGSQDSYSEEREASSQEDSSPSQEEPPASEYENEIPEEEQTEQIPEEPIEQIEQISEEEPTIEEIPGEKPIEPTEQIPEEPIEPTEQIPEKEPIEIPEPTNETIPPSNITIPENITIEPTEQIPEKEPIEIPEPTNETIPSSNITIPENITLEIPENLTIEKIIAENITISTTQFQAILGQPVKWKKHVDLEKQGIVKIKLPKDAENIIVNKIDKDIIVDKIGEDEILTELDKEDLEKVSEEIKELRRIRQQLKELEKDIEQVEKKLSEQDSYSEEQEPSSQEDSSLSQKEPPASEKPKAKFTITGGAIGVKETNIKSKSFFSSIINFFKKIFSSLTITGRVIEEKQTTDAVEVTINDTATQYEVEYETPAPYSEEEILPNNKGKKVKIIGPDSVHYENVTAYTTLNESLNIKSPSKIKIKWVEQNTYISPEKIEDQDSNGIYDYIEWLVPSLSNQTFEIIIEITKAEHLDENKTFISDIYNEVKALDEVWSETIPSSHYVRVVFEQKLDSTKDITIYPRTVSGTPKIEVYEVDGTTKITEFTSLNDNEYNKVYLTNLQNEQDTFDLRVVDGSVEFEHIIDPPDYTSCVGGTCTLVFNTTGLTTWQVPAGVTSITGLVIGGGGGGRDSTSAGGGGSGGDLRKSSLITVVPGATLTLIIGEGGVAAASNTGKLGGFSSISNSSTTLLLAAGGGEGTLAATTAQNGTSTTTGGVISGGTGGVGGGAGGSTTAEGGGGAAGYSGIGGVGANTTSANGGNGQGGGGGGGGRGGSVSIGGGGGGVGINGEGANGTGGTGASPANPGTGGSGGDDGVGSAGGKYGGGGGGDDDSPNAGDGGQGVIVITYSEPDSEYPQLTSLKQTPSNNSAYVFGQIFEFNSTITSTNRTAGIELNKVNITTTSNLSNVFNSTFSRLNASVHTYYWWAYGNGTNKNFNRTATQYYTISKATPTASLTNNTLWTRAYNGSGTTIGSSESNNGDGGVTYVIFQNNISQGQSDVEGGVGTYIYILNTTGGMNYSSAAALDTETLTITAIASSINLTLNNSQKNASIIQGNSINLNCTTISGDSGAKLALYRQGALLNNGTSPIYNLTTFNTVQSENITCIYQTSQNYTEKGQQWFVDVSASLNQAPTNPSPTITSSDNTNLSSVNLNCSSIIKDPDTGNTMNATVQWYNNSNLAFTYNYNLSYANNTLLNSTLSANYLEAWENWSCGMQLFDGVAYSSWINSSWNITILSTPPQVTNVWNSSVNLANGPNEATSTIITINFTAYDIDGFSNLNPATAKINVTGDSIPTVRSNSTCQQLTTFDSYYSNYSCAIEMWWWDASGQWNITAYIQDDESNSAANNSRDFYVGLRTSFALGPSILEWPKISPATTNQTATNDPLLLNNTGNDDIVSGQIEINATDLLGEENSVLGLWVGNFSVGITTGGASCVGAACTECAATQMNKSIFTNVTGALLSKGNYSVNDGTTGQEQLYLCLRYTGSELTTQAYSTQSNGAWTIRILLVSITGAGAKAKIRRKKKEKIKNKIVENLTLPSAIFTKKLGCLEAITKYMKDNLNMSYSEIANILNRNERTIWTAYKKAIEKEPETINLEKTMMMLPIIKLEKILLVLPTSIFENKDLTTLESIIIYLKENGMKYNEISKLLNRDQRNIWTTYSKAIKKK